MMPTTVAKSHSWPLGVSDPRALFLSVPYTPATAMAKTNWKKRGRNVDSCCRSSELRLSRSRTSQPFLCGISIDCRRPRLISWTDRPAFGLVQLLVTRREVIHVELACADFDLLVQALDGSDTGSGVVVRREILRMVLVTGCCKVHGMGNYHAL